MIDLDLDDSLDLEDADDLLALDAPQVKRPEPLLPGPFALLARCKEFAADIAAGRAAEVYYDGVAPGMELATYADLFEDWWARYQRKPSPILLELAFMCAVKNRAGCSWLKVDSWALGRPLRAEVIDCSNTSVRLAIDLPFEASEVKGNLQWLPRWRSMWFNRKTGVPVNPTEPFRLL